MATKISIVPAKGSAPIEISVGSKVAMCVGSDKYVFTLTAVSKDTVLGVDKSNPAREGRLITIIRLRGGRWIVDSDKDMLPKHCARLWWNYLGDSYMDPSF